MNEFSWVGSQENYVDKVHIYDMDPILIGRFGGNSSAGQYKNEDGCYVLLDKEEDWEFAVILDAHKTAESAELIIQEFSKHKTEIAHLFAPSNDRVFQKLEEKVLHIFQNKDFLKACENVQGETSCLIVARMEKYLWWFSVGDCILYLFHHELAKLGQYQVNQRHFYEWIGEVNTFSHEVPCYSSGTKELRKGINRILLTTDGLVECPNDPYSDPKSIEKVLLESPDDRDGIRILLDTIEQNEVRDSTTIITWKVNISEEGSMPSDL